MWWNLTNYFCINAGVNANSICQFVWVWIRRGPTRQYPSHIALLHDIIQVSFFLFFFLCLILRILGMHEAKKEPSGKFWLIKRLKGSAAKRLRWKSTPHVHGQGYSWVANAIESSHFCSDIENACQMNQGYLWNCYWDLVFVNWSPAHANAHQTRILTELSIIIYQRCLFLALYIASILNTGFKFTCRTWASCFETRED